MDKTDKIIKHDFLIGSYERLNDISVLKIFGFDIFLRVENVASIFGFVFIIENGNKKKKAS